MDTRTPLAGPKIGRKLCVYCGGRADTSDHVPSRCFLRRPLPGNLMTLPACKMCNTGFSFDENVVKTMLALTSQHPELAAEREPGGRVDRALARDTRLKSLIAGCRRPDGNYELVGEVLRSFDRVVRKTVQGLFFGIYERVARADELKLLLITDQRCITVEQVIEQVRPPGFRDITDEPLPEITPSGWVAREPVFFVKIEPKCGGEPVERLFRLMRDCPVEWLEFQPDAFRFAFVKSDGGGTVCVLDLWKTLVVAMAAPWPDGRGPIRRGRKNRLSRDLGGGSRRKSAITEPRDRGLFDDL